MMTARLSSTVRGRKSAHARRLSHPPYRRGDAQNRPETSRQRRFVGAIAWAMILLGGPGCLDHDLAESSTSTSVFIALQRDFSAYRTWPSLDLGEVEHAGSTGNTKIYYNRLPAPGRTAFDVGTILVKTIAPVGETDPVHWLVHAMSKRGGGFNEKGAFNWEFFELQLDASGAPAIVWRGEKPPTGEGYVTSVTAEGTVEEADCNSCHQSAHNDAVLSADLELNQL